MAPLDCLGIPEQLKPRKSFVKKNINESGFDDEFDKIRSTNNDNGNNNILKSMTLKSKNAEGFLSLKKPKKQQLLSSSKLIDINRNAKIKMISKSPNIESRKVKKRTTKKKPEKINEKLDIISKNIENTSKNINNPEEFYMNFFTNIINKKTKSENGNDHAENNVDSLLNPNSGDTDSNNTNKKNSNHNYLNLFDSMASKESNVNNSNMNLIKVKQKSGFGSKI